ncbi:MAG: MBL fold metallo-hydrolase, partial [Heliobacteriaceae bacterium]|nr:MBL fold metallo-hydrolase [Heliobacteriaceae bacterium]
MYVAVLPDFFRLTVPLPGNPLKAINAYLIKGPERNLLIDTGMNRPECLAALQDSLAGLGVDLNRTDFFLTHLHADHSGLIGTLAPPTAKVYCSQTDAAGIGEMVDQGLWEKLAFYAGRNGFPTTDLAVALQKHPWKKFGPQGDFNFTLVQDGDLVSCGNYIFRCIATPGHTGGHMCLYEPRRKLLVSGDHLLQDITPNIAAWSDGHNPLHQYIASLSKVAGLEIELVLPGHRRVFSGPQERIRELKEHHRTRNAEVLRILTGGPQSAYQVAT